MKIEIKSLWGNLLFEGDFSTLAEAVVAAVKKKIDLYGANLTRANLDGANLYGANLYGANLTRANLDGANLYGANLYGANLTRANLTRANLDGANLYGANLTRANLTRANLDGANLDGANLYGANLYGAKNFSPLAQAQISIVPSEGAFVGWKKCANGIIAKLLIPEGAERSNATGRKCRAEFVEVLGLFKGAKAFNGIAESARCGAVAQYEVGKTVKPDKWDKNRWEECSNGIHFFITRIEAENYCA